MQLISISLLLAASLASTVQARRSVEPHLRPRESGYGPYPTTSTVVVSPLPVAHVPMGTGVSPVAEPVATEVSNKTLTYTQGAGSSTTVITTTIRRTETLNQTETVLRPDPSANITAVGATGSHNEPTTTLTSRSTVTRTVTVEPVHSSDGGVGGSQPTQAGGAGEAQPTQAGGEGEVQPPETGGEGEAQPPEAGGEGEVQPPEAGDGDSAPGSTCAAVATVTETIKSTVTVTASPSGVPPQPQDPHGIPAWATEVPEWVTKVPEWVTQIPPWMTETAFPSEVPPQPPTSEEVGSPTTPTSGLPVETPQHPEPSTPVSSTLSGPSSTSPSGLPVDTPPPTYPSSEGPGPSSTSTSGLPGYTPVQPETPTYTSSEEFGPSSTPTPGLPVGTPDYPGAPGGTSTGGAASPTVPRPSTMATSTVSAAPPPPDGSAKATKAKECSAVGGGRGGLGRGFYKKRSYKSH